ncbi:hypothetical protein GCM10020367_52210 [Streptomyces sannanensis]|uniref:Cysteine-rich CPCC domain-containing protein n=1 Tax=Streptomyces sannanensis TaxID=285536 RepID=A0ABP6SHT7_9ACTN
MSAASVVVYEDTYGSETAGFGADAGFCLKAVEHLLVMFTEARLRFGQAATRCEDCGSYMAVAGVCTHCDWEDPNYQPTERQPVSDEERARRMATPCTPSSDISTFMSPHDL